MPLDATTWRDDRDAAGERAFRDFARKPSLEGLAYALRHPEVWPPSFTHWSYLSPYQCAIGLTHAIIAYQTQPRHWLARLWRKKRFSYGGTFGFEEMFQISGEELTNIFFRAPLVLDEMDPDQLRITMDISPSEVADVIDEVQRRRRAGRERIESLPRATPESHVAASCSFMGPVWEPSR